MRSVLLTCGEPDPSVRAAHGAYLDWFRAAIGPDLALHGIDVRVETYDTSLLEAVDAVIITGSPSSTYEPLPWIPRLEAFVRAAIERYALPVLGVCFGHQLVAQVCGGRVTRNPRGREMGTLEVTQTAAGRASALFDTLPESFAVQLTHCDTVAVPPPGACVLAQSALDGCQAFALGTAWGVQFHPEITAAIMRTYVHSRRDRLAAEGLDAGAVLATVRESDVGPRVLARFVAAVRQCRDRRDARRSAAGSGSPCGAEAVARAAPREPSDVGG